MGSNLIDRFKSEVGMLFLRRAVEGPLLDEEEARLADQHAELWDQIPDVDHSALERWIDANKAAPLREPVFTYVTKVREHLLRSALGLAGTLSGLEELMQAMTAMERDYVLAWRKREEETTAVAVSTSRVPFRESADLHREPRQRAA